MKQTPFRVKVGQKLLVTTESGHPVVIEVKEVRRSPGSQGSCVLVVSTNDQSHVRKLKPEA
jgi:hypothetical protein